jgi:hypothetical protein
MSNIKKLAAAYAAHSLTGAPMPQRAWVVADTLTAREITEARRLSRRILRGIKRRSRWTRVEV